MTITANDKQHIQVHGQSMAYLDRGERERAPLVFLHGNPTSSYLWRNIIAPLAHRFRCIAPDLIGMGDSDKLPPSGNDGDDADAPYAFGEHRRFLDAFLSQIVPLEPIVLVVHDWGSALGFDWARRHPDRVRGVVYMEAIVGVRAWSAFPPPARELFQALRSPLGESMILDQNLFVEKLLPGGILRELAPDEHAEYRRPFAEPGEGRRPTLAWPRQLPIAGEPANICAEVERYAAFMARSPIPKLFINAEPGRSLTGELREACRRWPNQTEVTVRGLHYIQEDSPAQIAEALASFAERVC
jgi:haloalkane dehalogenase